MSITRKRLRHDDPRPTVRIPTELYERLAKTAAAKYSNVTAEILTALAKYAAAEHSKAPADPHQKGIPTVVLKPRIPEDLYHKIGTIAEKHRRAISSEIRAAVAWHVKKEKLA